MTLLATNESDRKSVDTGPRRCIEASKEGKRWDGNLVSSLGLGRGEAKGGILKSWKWKFEMELGSQPCVRIVAW